MSILSFSSQSLHRGPRDEMSLELAAADERHDSRQNDTEPLGTIVAWADVDRMHADHLAQCDGVAKDDIRDDSDPDPKPPTAGSMRNVPREFVAAVARMLSDEDLMYVIGQPHCSLFDPEVAVEVYSEVLVERLESRGVNLDAA